MDAPVDASAGRSAPATLDWRRWPVLVGITLVGFVQCTAWMTYSGNPDVTREYYGLCSGPGPCPEAVSAIDMLLNWGPIMYLLVAPCVAAACSYRVENVWWVVLVASLLSTAGMIIRLLPSMVPDLLPPTSGWALWCLHVGQALNAAAGPANCSTPSILAAIWFPPEERTSATAAVFALQCAGPAVGFLLALPVRAGGPRALEALLAGEAALGLAATAVWALLPKRPSAPPSNSQELRGAGVGRGRGPPPRRWVSAAALFMAGGLVAGFFQIWSSSMPAQLEGLLPSGLLKWLAFAGNVAGVAGSLAVGPCVAKLGLGSRLRLVIAVQLAVQILGYGALALLLQASFSGSGPLMALLLAASLAQGAVGPLVYELSAELTYPHPESLSGTIYAMSLNGSGLLLGLVQPHLPSSMDTYSMVGACLAAMILLSLVREDYARQAVDKPPAGSLEPDGRPLCGAGEERQRTFRSDPSSFGA